MTIMAMVIPQKNEIGFWVLFFTPDLCSFIMKHGLSSSLVRMTDMLHAFDDSDGSELWAFIPPNLLDKLQALHADVVESFVDGSPKAYISYDSNGQITKAILIFGQRRGGNHYYALDITDPLIPKYLWKIEPRYG